VALASQAHNSSALLRTPEWHLRPGVSVALSGPRVVAIVNATPDSFAHGAGVDARATVDCALRAIDDGADVIDIGGESTRPGAAAVSEQEELQRVLPVIRAVRAQRGVAASIPITIDTTKAGVARAALDAGADAVNDISAGTDPLMLPLVASRGVGIILMHRVTTPERDSYSDAYRAAPMTGDVVDAVAAFLSLRVRAAVDAGIPRERIVIDPGLGFGKTVAQNLTLIHRTPELVERVGLPVLSALSRKSFVGRVGLGRDSTPGERLPATLALSTLHLTLGARLFRVHDVAAHRQALAAAWAGLHPPPPTPTS
jgi:dihydropteroate synthase